MSDKDVDASIKACYSTWSQTYYDDYYSEKAAYPPVHRELLKALLRQAKVQTILDAGCGPASFLRELKGEGLQLYGFDLTPSMVAEAKRVLVQAGVPFEHIWEGSVSSPESFTPQGRKEVRFDAALCIGVLPHIPEVAEIEVFQNLRQAVKKNGLVIVEARNKLFGLFTVNRYSYEFFLEELIRATDLKKRAEGQTAAVEQALEELGRYFRLDLPPVRKGKEGEPGYDQVLSRTHNPLVLKETFADAGFTDVRLYFYHYHCLPPLLEKGLSDLFRRESLAMEDPVDWRGYFMASAFILAGKRA